MELTGDTPLTAAGARAVLMRTAGGMRWSARWSSKLCVDDRVTVWSDLEHYLLSPAEQVEEASTATEEIDLADMVYTHPVTLALVGLDQQHEGE